MLMRVIIVEDEEIIRKGLEMTIDWMEMGCILVGTAENGLDGEALIRKLMPDIVITDIKMPKVSGLEMLSRLSDLHFYSIILTSYSEFELAKKALRLGVSDYLLKPVMRSELQDIIEKIKKKLEDKHRYEVIAQLSQEYTESEKNEWAIFEKAKNSNDRYVLRTYDLICRHYQEKISIQDVAETLQVSVSYLSRILKSNLNITFVDLLNQYRLKQAIKLLQNGDQKIYEISNQTGFTEYKHFASVFKKYTGSSPTEFMKNGSVVIQSMEKS